MTKKTTPKNDMADEENLESEAVDETVDSEIVDSQGQEDIAVSDVPDIQENPKTSATVVEKKSGVPAIVGGAVAAILGFGVAQFVPDGWPLAGADTSEIELRLDSQASEIEDLKKAVEAQSAAVSGKIDAVKHTTDLEALNQASTQGLADVRNEIVELGQKVELLTQRLADVEKRPISSNEASSAAVAAYERELTAMRETLAAQKTQIESVAKDAEAKIAEAQSQAEDLQAGAAATANAALLRAGLSHINTAIEGGGTFEAALADLTKATGQEPTAQLQAAAISGVATFADLRRTFPNAARAALAAAAVEVDDKSVTGRLGAFLRSQTGARSLQPREGSDPDAVLSRSEAAVGDGNLQMALQEISTLPEASQKAMAEWVKAATYRLETQAAVQDFVSSISEK